MSKIIKAYKIMENEKAIAAYDTREKAIAAIKDNHKLSIRPVNLCKSVISLMIKTDYTYFYKPMPAAWKTFFPVITVNELIDMGLNFTVKHNGKMSGMFSLSTTCKCNPACQLKIKKAYENLGIDLTNVKDARKAIKEYLKENPFSTNISICGFCFSDSQQDTFKNMTDTLKHNFDILNNGIIHNDYLPLLNNLYFRGESFGDFNSINSVINFYNIAGKNPLVSVTAWSKNLYFFYQAEKAGYKKPANFTLIYSSLMINTPAPIPTHCKHLVDRRFTVYTQEYAALNNISINCGARACMACLKCYKGNNFDICELLK